MFKWANPAIYVSPFSSLRNMSSVKMLSTSSSPSGVIRMIGEPSSIQGTPAPFTLKDISPTPAARPPGVVSTRKASE